MRVILAFALIVGASVAAGARSAHAQSGDSAIGVGSCLAFSFGAWTPPLDWGAAGHEGAPDSIAPRLAPGGREWAAELNHHGAAGTMLLFPSWWPVGVTVELPTRRLAPGDTVAGRATALVSKGSATPSSAAVRAWLVACGSRNTGVTPGRGSDAAAAMLDDRIPIGIWRGSSICITSKAPCGRDSVVYRIADSTRNADSVTLDASTVVRRGELPSVQLHCRFDSISNTLFCDTPAGVLRLSVRRTELGGRLTRHDGVDLRYIYVRRVEQ